jgi:predicted ribosomally synthesized peptide with SipW-like signal peptide
VATKRKLSVSKKLLLSLGALGSAAGIAGLGTFATFTSTTSASQTVTAGTVAISLGTAGTSANRLTISATGIVPGDTISRAVDLSSASSDPLASVSVTTTATTSSLLNTDTTNGLKMTVQRCPTAWTENTSLAPVYTYTCTGSTYVLGSAGTSGGVAVIQTAAALPGLAALSTGTSVDHLLVSLYLPTAAPNTMQGVSSTIQYAFTGTQRTGTAR